ncbi:hypothetical protein C3L33_07315, partial [Rhododendron williamsianum]
MALKSYHQGRCSAVALAAALLVSLILVETVHAATYTVGDSYGWDFSMGNWVKGKKFKAGDVLVFNYDPSVHNVAVVDAKGYKSCTSTKTSTAYNSGKDKVKLSKGRQFFICTIPGHCDGGLKIAVNAS